MLRRLSALDEASWSYPSASDLFGQFDDAYDNVPVLELMDVGHPYSWNQLAQFQVPAALESEEGRSVEVGTISGELDLPERVVDVGLGAEVKRGAARQTRPTTFRCRNPSEPELIQ